LNENHFTKCHLLKCHLSEWHLPKRIQNKGQFSEFPLSECRFNIKTLMLSPRSCYIYNLVLAT
jgi:hypothetical protein